MKLIFQTMAPNSADELYSLVCKKPDSIWLRGETSKLSNILDAVADCFQNGDTPLVRKHCLSIVAPFVSFSELQRHLPGISQYYYKEARYLARKFGFGKLSKPAVKRIRYDRKQVSSFISFITSPHIVSELPFGTATVIFSTGARAKIPNMMRMMIKERIVQQYLKFLEERRETNLAMSRSSLLRILDYCTASTRKSVHGIDYISFRGMESVDSLIKIIRQHGSTLDNEWISVTITKLKEAKLYLKGDFKLHVKSRSRISDHCTTFALSDPSKNNLQSSCEDHIHDLQCDNCEQLKSVLEDISAKMKNVPFSNKQDRTEVEYLLVEDVKNILEWRKHQLRSVHQDDARKHALESLNPKEIYMQLDWAMKFLPTSGREDQASWFGKRGIPWHITYMLAVINNQLHYRTYVHVFDPLSQDSNAIVAIVTDLLKRVKSEIPSLETAVIRSDNAGCYHSAHTLLSMPTVSQLTGIMIRRWDFSEPQFGKGPCDRIAALVKRHIRLFVNENNRCTNAEEFVRSATSYNGLKGTSFVHGVMLFPPTKLQLKFPGINTYSNFLFTSTDVYAWKAFQVGTGDKIPIRHDDINSLPKIDVVDVHHENAKESSVIVTTKFWINMYTQKEPVTVQNNEVEPSLYQTDLSSLFHCPEEGCIRSFIKHSNLLRHLILGKHEFSPQRTSLRDIAVQSYSEELESVRLTPEFPELQEAMQVFFETESFDSMERGWALKKHKLCRALSNKQRQFLIDKYNEGIDRRQKFDADVLSRDMRRNPAFSKEDFLTTQQIASFWSREASRRREEPTTYYAEQTEDDLCDDNTEVFEDPALYDPHLEIESDLINSECFE